MRQLTRLDRIAIAILVILVLALGVIVEIRSAFLSHRHTDWGCYVRAAWEVVHGGDLYAVTDDNGWHYNYPPLLAILLVPAADAPAGQPQYPWAIPYAVSVALAYLSSWAALAWGVLRLGRVLDGDAVAPRWSREFWWTRTWPVWLCLPAIGSTLSRGQVNLHLVAMLLAYLADALQGKHARAGWWLAAATLLKIIPAFLLIDPLLRRQWRTVGHYSIGLAVGGFLIPTLVLGPGRAWDANVTLLQRTLLPGLTNGESVVARELTNITGTDNQSLRAVLHNILHWDHATRPDQASGEVKLAHLVLTLGLLMLVVVASRRVADGNRRLAFRFGALCVVMVAASPVSHMHYMVLALPSVMLLVSFELRRQQGFRWSPAVSVLLVGYLASGILPRLPGLERLRDVGVALHGSLLVSLGALWLAARNEQLPPGERYTSRAAAAFPPLPVAGRVGRLHGS